MKCDEAAENTIASLRVFRILLGDLTTGLKSAANMILNPFMNGRKTKLAEGKRTSTASTCLASNTRCEICQYLNVD